MTDVRPATDADRAAWEEFVRARGSFLQSWRWGELRARQGWTPLRMALETDGQLVGALQALWRPFRPFGGILYAPRGPVVAEPAAIAPLLKELRPLARRRGAFLARIEPELPDRSETAEVLRRLGFARSDATVQLPHTVVVDLMPPEATILGGFKATWRRYIRHAPNRGVVVREGDAGDLETFYALERETAERQGIRGRPLAYYRAVWDAFAGAGIRLWLADLAGEPLAAIITLEFGATATYLYGGSTRRHSDAHANYLLQWTAMLHAKAAGCLRYDLWGTGTPGDAGSREVGLTAFKGGFAPITAWVGTWDLSVSFWSGPYRQLERGRRAFLRRTARKSVGQEREARVEKGALAVRDVTDAPAAKWDAWLAQCPGGGHWMQTHAWGEFKRQRGWRPLRIVLEEGGAVVGAGQIGLRTFPLVGTLAYCAKGPWLDWDNVAQVTAFFRGLRALLRGRRVFLLKIEPEALEEDTAARAALAALGFRKFRWDPQFKTTMIVDLTPPDDKILARMSQTARRYIRAAEREGVVVVEDNSLAAQEVFYGMMEVTSKRGNFFLRPRWYMRAYWQHMIDAGYGRFLFARKDGQDEVAMFLTNFGTRVYYKDGASLNEGRQSHAMYALQWAAMRWGKAHGDTSYDMVAIPPPDQLENREHEMWGLYEFKRKFGGAVCDYVGAYDQPYARRIAYLWDRAIEPVYYRLYMRLSRNVYY